ncbi:MAG TPA: ABC transporter ATP-binding protein [Candidatus Polarisedimenticolia bacterium]|nr:ABC transporter ATP-binding protein [Candidatus Polarisedimenticolia bacterium]
MENQRRADTIVAERLTRRFGPITAVDSLDLTVRAGEIFGFLGPNGAGKTTLVRLLCGLLAPTSGRATVAGHDVVRDTRLLKQSIGYMSQKFGLYADLTVRENVEFFGGVYVRDRREARERCERVLEEMGLESRAGQLAGTLSGGWKQRLAMATAIVHEPAILFLDEPTAGVDPVSRREIWDLIYALQGRGITLFVTTHYMEEAERCNRIGFINTGRLVALGTPAELKATRMNADVVSLAGPDLYAIYRALKGTDLVLDVNIYGNDVHAVVDDAGESLPAIRSRLESSGLAVDGAETIPPSIEDVFVRLTRGG